MIESEIGTTPEAALVAGYANWRSFANLVKRGGLPADCYFTTGTGRGLRLFHLARVLKWARLQRSMPRARRP